MDNTRVHKKELTTTAQTSLTTQQGFDVKAKINSLRTNEAKLNQMAAQTTKSILIQAVIVLCDSVGIARAKIPMPADPIWNTWNASFTRQHGNLGEGELVIAFAPERIDQYHNLPEHYGEISYGYISAIAKGYKNWVHRLRIIEARAVKSMSQEEVEKVFCQTVANNYAAFLEGEEVSQFQAWEIYQHLKRCGLVHLSEKELWPIWNNSLAVMVERQKKLREIKPKDIGDKEKFKGESIVIDEAMMEAIKKIKPSIANQSIFAIEVVGIIFNKLSTEGVDHMELLDMIS